MREEIIGEAVSWAMTYAHDLTSVVRSKPLFWISLHSFVLSRRCLYALYTMTGLVCQTASWLEDRYSVTSRSNVQTFKFHLCRSQVVPKFENHGSFAGEAFKPPWHWILGTEDHKVETLFQA